jgi:hypothetical protein
MIGVHSVRQRCIVTRRFVAGHQAGRAGEDMVGGLPDFGEGVGGQGDRQVRVLAGLW